MHAHLLDSISHVENQHQPAALHPQCQVVARGSSGVEQKTVASAVAKPGKLQPLRLLAPSKMLDLDLATYLKANVSLAPRSCSLAMEDEKPVKPDWP